VEISGLDPLTRISRPPPVSVASTARISVVVDPADAAGASPVAASAALSVPEEEKAGAEQSDQAGQKGGACVVRPGKIEP
jgi:hypothetical protein